MEFTLSKSLIKPTNHRYFFNTTFVSSSSNPLIIKNPSNLTFTPLTTASCTLKLSKNPTSFLRFSFPNLKPLLSRFRFSFPNLKPLLSYLNPFSGISAAFDGMHRVLVGHYNNPIEWNLLTSADGELGHGSEEDKKLVVLLGWLGCDEIHLRKYADMYNRLGVNAVTFTTSVNDVLDFAPPINNSKARIEVLIDEIAEWLQSKNEDDHRERFLVFHTFSNIGWLAYGAILNILQGREEILKKIKGCVVDSGGAPEFDPKVWAAEFTRTLLTMFAESGERQTGTTYEDTDDEEFLLFEADFVAKFEEIITGALETPEVDVEPLLRRLKEVTSTLSENQPNHPQLYLYSTVDRVVPFQKIESFAKHQKKLGRKVMMYNFESSLHVDHYRTFPDKYRSLIQNFLKDCVAGEGRQLYKLLKSSRKMVSLIHSLCVTEENN